MNWMGTWLLALLVATAGSAAQGGAQGSEGANSADPAMEIESSIEQARARLDRAARELAELHEKLWKLETSGPRAQRPMLGILLQDAGTAAGLTLAGVTPDGGAEQAGLMAGDTVVEVNGVRLDQGGERKPLTALSEALSSVRAGDTIPVTYVRDGETFAADVTTQARGHYMARVVEEKGPWLDSLRELEELEDLEALEGLEELDVLKDLEDSALRDHIVRAPSGLRLESVSGELARYFEVDRGVVVMAAPERVPELRGGDVLLAVDGDAVTDATAALRQMAGLEGEVAVRVKRRGAEQTVTLDADALNAKQALHVFRTDRRIRLQRGGHGEPVRLEIVVDDD